MNNMVMEGNCGEHILTHGLDSSVHGAAATMMSSAGASPVERKTKVRIAKLWMGGEQWEEKSQIWSIT